MWITDNDTLRFLAVNDSAVRIYGYTREEFLGMSISDITVGRVPKDLESLNLSVLETYCLESSHIYKDREVADVEETFYPINFNQKQSQLTHIRDITAKKKRIALAEYLKKATEQLSIARDTKTALDDISDLIVPRFADWFTINVVNGEDIDLIMVKNSSQEYMDWAQEHRKKNPLTIHGEGATQHALRTGESFLVPVVTPEMLEQTIKDKEQLEMILKLNLRSSIIVPMKVQNSTIGTINFISTVEGKKYDEIDLDFAYDFATRIGFSLENARLHEQAAHEKRQVELSQYNLNRMVMQTPVAMCILAGSEYLIEVANDKMFELWGISKEYEGNPIFNGLPHLEETFKPLLNDVYFNDKTLNFEEIPIDLFRNGALDTRFVNFTYQPVKELDGSTSGVLAVAIDVTAQVISRRKIEDAEQEAQAMNEELSSINEELSAANEQLIKAGDALSESEERLALAVENSEAGVFDTDLVTGRTVRSVKHAQIYGYPGNAEEWTTDKMSKHIVPEDYQLAYENYLKSLKTGRLYSEFRINRADNIIRWINLVGKVYYDSEGVPVRIIGTTTDITEKKDQERIKDDFVSTVSHELKTPVTSIKAYSQLLQVKLRKTGDSGTMQFLDRMDVQIGRLQSLIKDLLDITRFDQNQLILRKEQLNLGTLLTETIAELQLVTPTHQLLLTRNDSISCKADKDRLIQVITNLVTNAVKYSPSADKVNIELRQEEGKIVCSIQDFGIGIPVGHRERIFDRFHQVATHHDQAGLSLGLGLYISKEIISNTGGELWLESEEGKGSTFYFSLPACDDE